MRRLIPQHKTEQRQSFSANILAFSVKSNGEQINIIIFGEVRVDHQSMTLAAGKSTNNFIFDGEVSEYDDMVVVQIFISVNWMSVIYGAKLKMIGEKVQSKKIRFHYAGST